MHISSIIDIVKGELSNSPSISFIYNFKTQLNKVYEGDLFISNDEIEIKEAIQKGAFGIIYDFDLDVIDNEIAWIKVDNISNAVSNLIRFKLSNLDLKAYYCNKISYELLSLFVKTNDETIKLISENLEEEIDLLENIKNTQVIICRNREILSDIYPNNENFNSKIHPIKNLIEHSLFETTFSCENDYFPRLKMPSFNINSFLDVYSFLNCALDINKLKKLESFKPYFVDKYIKSIEYGGSDKFILSHTNIEQATTEIKYLNMKYKYAKTFIFSKTDSKIQKDIVDYYINNLNEIKVLLNNKKFNALYIVGFSNENILDFITKNSSKALL